MVDEVILRERWVVDASDMERKYRQQGRMQDGQIRKFKATTRESMKLHAGIMKVSAEMRKTGTVGSQAFRAVGASVSGVLSVAGAVSLSMRAIRSDIEGITKANQGLSASLNEFAKTRIVELDKLRIQSGLSQDQVVQMLPQINAAQRAAPVTGLAGSFAGQRQLVSSGFAEAGVKSGETLKTAFEILAATGQINVQPEEVSKSIRSFSKMLSAMGKTIPTEADLRQVGIKTVGLFKARDIQLPDFSRFANDMSGVLGGLDGNLDDALAAYTALAEVSDAAAASTGLRSFILKAKKAGTSKGGQRALSSIGLKGEDIDLIGESLPQVLERLNKARQNVDKKTFDDALLKIFETEGFSVASSLLNVAPKIDLIKSQDLPAASGVFDRNVSNFAASQTGFRKRDEFENELATLRLNLRQQGLTIEDVRRVADTRFKTESANAKSFRQRGSVIRQKQFLDQLVQFAESSGMTPESVISLIDRAKSGATADQLGVSGLKLNNFTPFSENEGSLLDSTRQSLLERQRRFRRRNEAVNRPASAPNRGFSPGDAAVVDPIPLGVSPNAPVSAPLSPQPLTEVERATMKQNRVRSADIVAGMGRPIEQQTRELAQQNAELRNDVRGLSQAIYTLTDQLMSNGRAAKAAASARR